MRVRGVGVLCKKTKTKKKKKRTKHYRTALDFKGCTKVGSFFKAEYKLWLKMENPLR